jgi:hypothetical protein
MFSINFLYYKIINTNIFFNKNIFILSTIFKFFLKKKIYDKKIFYLDLFMFYNKNITINYQNYNLNIFKLKFILSLPVFNIILKKINKKLLRKYKNFKLKKKYTIKYLFKNRRLKIFLF